MARRVLGAFVAAILGAAGPAEAEDEAKGAEPASAEKAAPPGPGAQPAEARAPGARPEATEDIVVTGSRVKRKDLTTPAPVVVIDRDQIVKSGFVSIGELLQTLPEQSNSMNRNWNNGGDGSVRVNMRGLGSYRTLVLLNGRRVVAGGLGADTSADLTAIPSAAIERVEILKDGASPMYGSDAIGGVVNIITRRSWSGAEVAGYSGISSRGDGGVYSASFTTGRASDEGALLLSAGYTQQDPVWAGKRAFSKNGWAFDLTGQTNPLGQLGEFANGSGATPAGRVFVPYPLRPGQTVPNPNGDPNIDRYNQLVTLSPRATSFVPDASVPGGWRPWAGGALPQYGGDQWNYAPDNYLVTPARTLSLFATGDARLGTSTRAFFETNYANRASRQKLAPEPFLTGNDGIVVSAQNQYNPFGIDLTDVRRRLVEFGNRTFAQRVETLRVLGGIEGTLPDRLGPLSGWTWEASVGQGRTQATLVVSGYTRISKMRDALGPSFQDAQGNWHCGTPATGAIDGCVPLNLFGGPGSIDASQVAALTFDGTARGTNATSAVLATLTGSLFPLLADRPVGVALGYEYRGVSGLFVPDPVTAAYDVSTDGGQKSTNGSQDAHEAFAELSLPIASGFPLAENVEALAAARVFRYSGFGTDWTWKLGGRWTPIRGVTLRGTWSTAFRAPGVSELYFGAYHSQSASQASDPCAGVDDSGNPRPVSPWCGAAANNGSGSPSFQYTYQGNPALRPETARVITAGVVLEPRFAKNLSLTVDAWDVQIADTIHSPGGLQIQACYPMTTAVRPTLCEYVQRDPVTQRLTGLLDTPVNAGTERMRGVDFALRYALPTPIGRFGALLDATYLDRYDITRPDGSVLHVRGTQDALFFFGPSSLYPSWKYNAGVTWGWRGLGAGVGVRYVGGYRECGDIGGFIGTSQCSLDSTFERRVRASDVWDAYASYAFTAGAGKTSLSLGVQNVFDAQPPRVYSAWMPSDPGYDFVGRFFYARLTHRL